MLNNIPLKFNQDKTLRIIYHGNTNVSEQRKKELNDIIEDSYRLINPKALYTSLTIKKVTGEKILLENGKRLKSSFLVKKLKCSPELIFYLITIGDRLERRVGELSENILQAFILDRIGTYACKRIDVKLNDNYLMIPKKSVSGVMGLTKQKFYECQICKKNCEYRRKRFNPSFSEA